MRPDHGSTKDGNRVLKKTDDAIGYSQTSSDGGSIVAADTTKLSDLPNFIYSW